MKKNVSIIFPKKFLTIVGFLLLSSVADAQVMWNLKGGFTRRVDHRVGGVSQVKLYENVHKCTDWMAGLEMEIPLNRLLNIETGLRYRNYNTLVIPEVFSGDALYATSHFELPLRLTYKQQLGKHFSLHAGVGPYVSYAAGDDFGEKWNNNLQVGLEPSIAINWACLSLGATFNTPCFYKGYKDENKPVVMATLGIRFKSHVWKYVGATLLAIASVGAAAAVVWPSNDGYSSYSSDSYSPSYSNSSSSSYSGSSSSSIGKSCKFCAGSGRCSGTNRCRGDGQCKYCYGQGYQSTNGHYHECGVCKGTKKCTFCGGSGKCKHCGGTGKK